MLFSVVIPVFNVEAYLQECLESVRCQTCADWECVCVDDGSTDGSARILDDYARRDSRFRVIHQANAGVAAARNRALDFVLGDFVIFLDGDDVLVGEQVLELFDKTIRQAGKTSLLLFGIFDWIVGQPRPRPSGFDQKAAFHDTSSCVEGRVSSKGFSAGVYPRTLIGDIRFPRLRIGEDRLFFAEVLMRADLVAVHPAKVYVYRRRPGSAMAVRLGVRDLLDDIVWRLEVVRAYQRAGKRMSPGGLRGKALFLTESVGFERRKLDVSDRLLLDPKWKEALRCVSGSRAFPLWNRTAATLALWFPANAVYWGLFWLPMWLKKHGVHFPR